MGAWGYKPFDSDDAADWGREFMEKTGIRDEVRKALELDIELNDGTIRAAASVLAMLGQHYLWPTDHKEEDLTLASQKLKEIRKDVEKHQNWSDPEEFFKEIDSEIAALEDKLENPRTIFEVNM